MSASTGSTLHERSETCLDVLGALHAVWCIPAVCLCAYDSYEMPSQQTCQLVEIASGPGVIAAHHIEVMMPLAHMRVVDDIDAPDDHSVLMSFGREEMTG